jgi:hypothetical protein
MTDDFYSQWLAERRAVFPPAAFADQIMSRVVELDRQQQTIWWVLLVRRVERSRAGRWAVCGGALAVGCLPFAFLAHVAWFVTF